MPRPTAEPRHVVLLGGMGAGKTTVGRILAERLGRPFLDGDVVLEATRGMTAAEIAATGGIEALHADEAATLRYLLGQTHPSVIAPAASVVEDAPSVAALEDPALLVVWLAAGPETLEPRAAVGAHRPFQGPDLAAHLRDRAAVRDPVFERLAVVIVDVEGTPPLAAVDAIETALRARRSGSR